MDGLCEGMVCVKGWFVWRDGLCEGMEYKLIFFSLLHIIWFVQRDAYKSHSSCLHTNHKICNTEKGKWFVWRDGFVWRDDLCDGIGMICVKGWFVWRDKWFVWRDGLHPFAQTKPSHKPFIILCITYYLVCVKGYDKWFVWRDGLCEGLVCVSGLCEVTHSRQYVIQRSINGLLEGMVFLHSIYLSFTVLHALTQTIYHSLYYIPSLHTNHPFTQIIPSHKPSLHTNHPFTQTINSHKPSLHTNHPFTQTRQYVIQRSINGFVKGCIT